MNGRISRSFHVAGESYRVLRSNPGLIVFPILSVIATVLVSIPFVVPLWLASAGAQATKHHAEFTALHYVLLFCLYFVNYFVTIFFNAGLVACAYEELNGRRSTVGYGVEMAIKRLPQILGWTVVAATVGVILKAISERVGIIGTIVIALVGIVWNVAVFFVVPCLVIERVGPITALKTSVGMIKNTWGERIVLGIGLGTATGLLMLLCMVPFGIAIALFVAEVWWLAICFIAIGIMYIAVVGLLSASMNTIFQTALFMYSRTGVVPNGFQEATIQGAFREKPARTVFGKKF